MKLQHIQRFSRGNMDDFVFWTPFYLFSAHFAPILQHGAYITLLNAKFFRCLSTHPTSLQKYEVTVYPDIKYGKYGRFSILEPISYLFSAHFAQI